MRVSPKSDSDFSTRVLPAPDTGAKGHRMPIIIHSSNGTVVGLFGTAQIRSGNGTFRPLKIGDPVQKGDIILTSEDGIVEFTRSDEVPRVVAPAEVIAQVVAVPPPPAEPPPEPKVEDGSELLSPERVARVSEPMGLPLPKLAAAGLDAMALEDRRMASESLLAERRKRSSITSGGQSQCRHRRRRGTPRQPTVEPARRRNPGDGDDRRSGSGDRRSQAGRRRAIDHWCSADAGRLGRARVRAAR